MLVLLDHVDQMAPKETLVSLDKMVAKVLMETE